jgi:PAS domain S-box-containing protein
MQVNKKYHELLGYTRTRLKIKTFNHHPEDLKDDVGEFRKTQAGEIREYSMEKSITKLGTEIG